MWSSIKAVHSIVSRYESVPHAEPEGPAHQCGPCLDSVHSSGKRQESEPHAEPEKRLGSHTGMRQRVKIDLITWFTTIQITQTQIQVVNCSQFSRGSTPGSVQKSEQYISHQRLEGHSMMSACTMPVWMQKSFSPCPLWLFQTELEAVMWSGPGHILAVTLKLQLYLYL